MNLEECSGCGVSGWGWQDNGYGTNMLGPLVFFEDTGLQTIRIQPREDGLAIDQIVLSPERFLTAAPGALVADLHGLFDPQRELGGPKRDLLARGSHAQSDGTAVLEPLHAELGELR